MPSSLLDRVLRRRSPRVYLHIGAMKTGTTYLQSLLGANRAELEAAGVLFPGQKFTDQSRAVREILFEVKDPLVRARTRGKWAALVAQVRAHRGRSAILSMEFLSFADTEKATKVVESFEGLDVHVILTVRDAERAIPAQWQTSARNGSRVTYQKFVRGARYVRHGKHAPRGRGSHLFERTQGIPRMLEVWVPLVGPKNVHVITVPPSGSDPALLWQRFAKVVKVKPKVAQRMPEAANPSLGHASSELLRRVNKVLGKVPPVDYWKVVKGQLARGILGARAGQERPVRLHRGGVRLARQWNGVVREAIQEHGVDLVGSLDELPLGPPDADLPKKLYKPSEEEILDAATTAYAGMLRLREEYSARAGLPAPERPAQPDWRAAEEPVDAAVADVVALVRECMELRHRFPDPEDDTEADADDEEDSADDVS